jgi:hypothetical protein
MTMPDRTDELVRAMLERRAGEPVPAWLLGSVMGQVVAAGRTRGRTRGLASMSRGAGRHRALVAVVVLLVGVFVGAALGVGFLELTGAPGPTQPAAVLVPTAAPSPATVPSAPPATPAATAAASPPPTPRRAPDTLGPDAMAVVTEEGDRLRVRTAPGVGNDSRMLNPLLRTGDRMLVISGPVVADGYDWYEVRTAQDAGPPYGWVASGKDGKAWIAPTAPVCPDPGDDPAVVALDPIDFLLCNGDRAIVLHGTSLGGSESVQCPWTEERSDCRMLPTWMRASSWLQVGEGGVHVAIPPDLLAEVDRIPPGASLTATVAADVPEAESCRIVDATDRDVVERSRAVIECRLTLVLRDLTWEEAPGPATTSP